MGKLSRKRTRLICKFFRLKNCEEKMTICEDFCVPKLAKEFEHFKLANVES